MGLDYLLAILGASQLLVIHADNDGLLPLARGLRADRYENREIRRKPPLIIEAMGPIAFGKRSGDDARIPVMGLGEFGAGNVKNNILKFIPAGSENEVPNGGTFLLSDKPNLGYMDRETTAGKSKGSNTKMNIFGLGKLESLDETEQGTGLLDFSKNLFPFLALPPLKTDESVDREYTDVDPRLGETFYSHNTPAPPNDGKPHFIPSVDLISKTDKSKEVSNPFDGLLQRPRVMAAKTHKQGSSNNKVEDLDLINEGEGFIPQEEEDEEEEEPVTPEKPHPGSQKNDGIPTEHKLNHVLGRVPIKQLGLAPKDVYKLCSKFAPIAAKVCYGPKVFEEWVARCQGYQQDCADWIEKSRPLGAIANSFNSGVGLTYYDWAVNGIPYYAVNEEGGIANGHHGKVDFGSWGGGYSDNIGVRDYYSQTGEWGANWYEGMYGYKTGWSIPIAQSLGIEGGQGTQVHVPLKEGDIGKPVSVSNGYFLGPYFGVADKVGVDWYNGGVSFNRGVASPFVGVNVNTGTSVGFPSIGTMMNRMGLNGLDVLNKIASASTFESPGITSAATSGLAVNSNSGTGSRYYYY